MYINIALQDQINDLASNPGPEELDFIYKDGSNTFIKMSTQRAVCRIYFYGVNVAAIMQDDSAWAPSIKLRFENSVWAGKQFDVALKGSGFASEHRATRYS